MRTIRYAFVLENGKAGQWVVKYTAGPKTTLRMIDHDARAKLQRQAGSRVVYFERVAQNSPADAEALNAPDDERG